jgi:hypothetical protein
MINLIKKSVALIFIVYVCVGVTAISITSILYFNNFKYGYIFIALMLPIYWFFIDVNEDKAVKILDKIMRW